MWLLHSVGSVALACGGFFCDTVKGTEPGVEQAGEVVVFAQSGTDITMDVQLTYEGPADEFAWILPLPAEPEVKLSVQTLFDVLQSSTFASSSFFTRTVGCSSPQTDAGDSDVDSDTDSDTDADTDLYDDGSGLDVTVLQNERVGPYDSVVLRAENTADLVAWLQLNGYNVPENLSGALKPYLTPNAHFLALKLAKGNDVGNMAPVRLVYTAPAPSIPIQLTSVAAVEDMPLTVYMMGDRRGVPLSYLHVVLHPVAWDHFSVGDPLDDVIAEAVDEAGGRAFVTLYSGTNPSIASFRADATALSKMDAYDWFVTNTRNGWGTQDEFLDVVRQTVPIPDDVDESSFLACPDCFEKQWRAAPFDAAAATDLFFEQLVDPYNETLEMLSTHRVLTRMQSALSPGEMTVDPTFTWNASLPTVSRSHQAAVVATCSASQTAASARREIEAEGFTFKVPPLNEVPSTAELGRMLWDSMDYRSLRVEQMTADGAPDVLVDRTEDVITELRDGTLDSGLASDVDGADCGCKQGGPTSLVWLAGLLPWTLRRRRA